MITPVEMTEKIAEIQLAIIALQKKYTDIEERMDVLEERVCTNYNLITEVIGDEPD
jgi:flagellar capping protein FliD